ERQVAQLELKYRDDSEVKALRVALSKRKGQEIENKRVAALKPFLEAFDAAMQAAQPDLVKARSAILDAEKHARPEELGARKTLLAGAEFNAEKARAFKEADDAIANKVTGLEEAQ